MQHLAIIPDGNRRWAVKNKLESVLGHRKGTELVRTAVEVCIKKGIKYLSFYTFSLENFHRTEHEKNYLFDFLVSEFDKQIPELVQQGIRIKFLGDLSLFPQQVQDAVHVLEQKTQQMSVLQLNLLFGYGAQQEIAYAMRAIADKIKAGILAPESITPDMIKDHLWTTGIPDPDLIIRAGKVSRMSNFLLYQAAYSEWMFLDLLWPEVTEAILEESLEKFKTIKRNFGT